MVRPLEKKTLEIIWAVGYAESCEAVVTEQTRLSEFFLDAVYTQQV